MSKFENINCYIFECFYETQEIKIVSVLAESEEIAEKKLNEHYEFEYYHCYEKNCYDGVIV